jgi:glycolate oxidase FAD binding subunit
MTAAVDAGARVEARLRKVAPAGWFDADPAAYAVDGTRPAFAVAPDSQEAVAAVLAEANAAAAAVIPWGGGSRMGLGMPPERYDIALSLSRLARIVDHEPADLTLTVEAGVRLADLQALLAERGQWLPLDPPGAEGSTIGGLLATNASGPARIACGTARDLVIGMTVATAEGRLVKSGGRVVKNVAGYDMAKMHIGALGSLGVITQVSLKVAPLPKASRVLTAESDKIDGMVRLAFEVRDAALPATAVVLARPAGGPARLVMRFAGGQAAVSRAESETQKLAKEAGLSVEQAPVASVEATTSSVAGQGIVALISHRASEAAALIAGAPESAHIVSLPTAGSTRVGFLTASAGASSALEELRLRVESLSGALVLEAAPIETRTALGVWGLPPKSIGLMRSLKQQLDPSGILNPGRFVGGI